MSRSTAKEKEWFRNRCKNGCQICGIKKPELKNNGLKFSHIISKGDAGSDEEINCLALCPKCADSFDYTIKPAIYHALKRIDIYNVPEGWKSGEGRINPDIS